MSIKASRAFTSAFMSAVTETVTQIVRHPEITKRLVIGATAVISSLAIAMAVTPIDAQAQNSNSVSRVAIDVIGGIAGGAVGNQFGGGSGKKAATVAGVAAGVWAAEALQQEAAPSGGARIVQTGTNAIGPVITSGWSNTRVPGAEPRFVQARGADRQARLVSGTTPVSSERMNKLMNLEGTFLASRDTYARAIFAAEQAVDDTVLEPGSREAQQRLASTRAQQRQAQADFENARSSFTGAVEHMGTRGYDVHMFAHSHKIAQSRVTATDMNRGDVMRVTRGARIHDEYSQNDSVRETYTYR